MRCARSPGRDPSPSPTRGRSSTATPSWPASPPAAPRSTRSCTSAANRPSCNAPRWSGCRAASAPPKAAPPRPAWRSTTSPTGPAPGAPSSPQLDLALRPLPRPQDPPRLDLGTSAPQRHTPPPPTRGCGPRRRRRPGRTRTTRRPHPDHRRAQRGGARADARRPGAIPHGPPQQPRRPAERFAQPGRPLRHRLTEVVRAVPIYADSGDPPAGPVVAGARQQLRPSVAAGVAPATAGAAVVRVLGHHPAAALRALGEHGVARRLADRSGGLTPIDGRRARRVRGGDGRRGGRERRHGRRR